MHTVVQTASPELRRSYRLPRSSPAVLCLPGYRLPSLSFSSGTAGSMHTRDSMETKELNVR